MFAIYNKKTKKFVYGTDFRYHPYRQRTSRNEVRTYSDLKSAEASFEHRQCGKDYAIVEIEVKIIREIHKGEETDND